eukprot:6176850-Pleurochrysis_carterae.AAC.3
MRCDAFQYLTCLAYTYTRRASRCPQGVLSTLATTLIGAKVNAGRPGPVLPNVAINLFRWQGGSEGGWQLVLWGDKGDFACETPLAGQSYRPYWSLAACTGLAFVAGAFAGSRLRSITP